MFENLDTTNAKKFRKSLVTEFAGFLKSLREQDEGITESRIWGELQELKGHLFNHDVSIHAILDKIEKISLSNASSSNDLLQKGLQDMLAIRANPRYQTLMPMLGTTFATASGAFFAKKQDELPQKITLDDSQQVMAHFDDPSSDQTNVVMSMMRLIAPENYNGQLIDIDKDVASKISRDGLDHLSTKEKLLEIENRTNQMLAMTIDEAVERNSALGKDRLQIIFKSGVHFTAVDIDFKNMSCLVVDAAQDFRRIRLHDMTKYSQYIKPDNLIDAMSGGFEFEGRIINGGGLQKAERGCDKFAIYHSFMMAQMKDIHELARAKSVMQPVKGIRSVSWMDLPPEIVCVSQSVTFLSCYLSTNPQHADKIRMLTNNNQKGRGFDAVVAGLRLKLQTALDKPTFRLE